MTFFQRDIALIVKLEAKPGIPGAPDQEINARILQFLEQVIMKCFNPGERLVQIRVNARPWAMSELDINVTPQPFMIGYPYAPAGNPGPKGTPLPNGPRTGNPEVLGDTTP